MTRCPTELRKDIRAVDGSGEFVARRETYAATDRTFLGALRGAIVPPSDLVWRKHFSTNQQDPKGLNTSLMQARVAQAMEKRELAEKLRTDRDPCPKCGVRRDVGCKHTGGRA